MIPKTPCQFAVLSKSTDRDGSPTSLIQIVPQPSLLHPRIILFQWTIMRRDVCRLLSACLLSCSRCVGGSQTPRILRGSQWQLGAYDTTSREAIRRVSTPVCHSWRKTPPLSRKGPLTSNAPQRRGRTDSPGGPQRPGEAVRAKLRGWPAHLHKMMRIYSGQLRTESSVVAASVGVRSEDARKPRYCRRNCFLPGDREIQYRKRTLSAGTGHQRCRTLNKCAVKERGKTQDLQEEQESI